jgi:hypothetical protein
MLTIPEVSEKLEAAMVQMPQAECPVMHHFGPGVYIREVSMPAGTLVLGHKHRYAHMNILVKGRLKFLCEDGVVREFAAPMVMTGNPGRKLALILEDTVWQNIYATEVTNPVALEEILLDKSPAWHEYAEQVRLFEQEARQADREDFLKVIGEFGLDEPTVELISQMETDQIEFPPRCGTTLVIQDSAIHGKGMYSTVPAKPFDVLAPARLNGKRTPAGRWVNHSKDPNCFFVKNDVDDIWLLAMRDIAGCQGGDPGEELTVDYKQALLCAETFKLKNP